MARGQWTPCGSAEADREISNVVITITDKAAVAEGETVTAVCNGKTFSSAITKGIAKIYTSEVGTYIFTAGDYSTMLICPYFGQFSTDIYSGTLVVTCMESGGNNKTCHVQSCDDEYHFTNQYNLTQTFDESLELIFLGIPAGKYLVTIDGRYRFFKEVISIQKVNEIEVELKQWLYKDGDQCVHNTGGWMKCLIADNSKAAGRPISDSSYAEYTLSQSIDMLSDCIRITHNSTAIKNSLGNSRYGYVARIDCALFAGTQKHNSIDISKYTKLTAKCNQNLLLTLRTGAANTNKTAENTATVLASTKGQSVTIAAALGSSASVVIGLRVYSPGYGWDTNGNQLDHVNIPLSQIPSHSNSINASISQIYLA